jgi:EmrB/QacA subfamily drug resistance transporter
VSEDRIPGDGAEVSHGIAVAEGRVVPAWVVLLLVCLGQFMVILDISIVNVALPSIRADLGFTASGLQWVVNAYTLAFAGFLLLGGRAADLYGRRRMFLIGLGVFTLASLAGGLAQNQGMLIAARALQGLGGAILAPATLTILATSFPEGPARARAFGIWGAVAAGGGAAGVLLGGILTDLISWRWILFVNVPIGAAALVAARAVLGESRGVVQHRSLDVAGAVTVTGGLVALVYAIVRTETYGWASSQVLVPLIVAVVLLGAFLFIETRVARAPLMPLRIFRNRSIAGANLYMLLLGSAIFSVWYFLSLYFQNVLGYSPLKAGFAFLPQTIAIAVGAQISSRVVTRLGPRPLLMLGPTLTATGLLLLTGISSTSPYFPDLLGPTLLITLGLGLSFPASTLAATTGIRREEAGLASGLINTNRQIGGSIGLAALATLAANRTATLLAAAGSGAHAATPGALTSGFARAFGFSGAICLAAALVALAIIPSVKRPSAGAAPGPEPAMVAGPGEETAPANR